MVPLSTRATALGPWVRRARLGVIIALAAATPVAAQNLTPRAYWPAPEGTWIFALGFAYQEGEVATDPSLPIQDLEARVSSLQGVLVHFFELAGRTASLTVEVPWTEASLDAVFLGERTSGSLSGSADLKARLAVNLKGAPAMDPAAFRNFVANPEPLLGLSLRLQAPTGEYDPERRINLGSNRWSIRPEIGYLRPLRNHWILELGAGAWIFEDNDDFQGRRREQETLLGGEAHLSRRVRRAKPNFWVSFDFNFFTGGRTRVGGLESDDHQRNSRAGLTMVFPVTRGHSLKVAGNTSLVTERGGDYSAFSVAYQRVWR